MKIYKTLSSKYRQSLVKTLFKLFISMNKVQYHRTGNLQRAKVPRYPKGKLGCVLTHKLSEKNSLIKERKEMENYK